MSRMRGVAGPRLVALVVLGSLVVLGAACRESGVAAQGSPAACIPVLEALRLPDGLSIVVDGGMADEAWRRAREIVVPLRGDGVAEVRLKAAYDAGDVYLLAVWSDPQRSMNRHWTDTGGTTWELSRREDALSFCWPPGSYQDAFREQGCAMFCHDGKHVFPGTSGSLADFWYWGAQSTAFHAQALDMQLRQGAEHRLRGDSQPADAGNVVNRSPEYEGPAYFPQRIGRDTAFMLLYTNAVPVGRKTKAAQLSGERNVGRRIPYDVLRARAGSRGDVRAVSCYHEGKSYVLELARRLDTGNAYDLPLGDPIVPAYFSVAVHQDAEGEAHAVSGPIELRFVSGE
jgi:hypothetical protein